MLLRNSICINSKISLVSLKFIRNITPILNNIMKLFPIVFVGKCNNTIFLPNQIIAQYISLPLFHKEF